MMNTDMIKQKLNAFFYAHPIWCIILISVTISTLYCAAMTVFAPDEVSRQTMVMCLDAYKFNGQANESEAARVCQEFVYK